MGKPIDLLQGTLDLLILKTLGLEPMHGWGISQPASMRRPKVPLLRRCKWTPCRLTIKCVYKPSVGQF